VYGRWKALHYIAKRFFAPVLVSLLEDHDAGTVEVHVSNHRPKAFRGAVNWIITDAAGSVLEQGNMEAEVPSQTNKCITTLSCQVHREAGDTARLPLEIRNHNNIPMAGDRDLLVWALLEEDGEEISRNLGWFAKPKYWKLQQPEIQVEVTTINGKPVIKLKSSHASPWTRLSLRDADATFSDNFLHLLPGQPVQVSIEKSSVKTIEEIAARLTITPFVDLFPNPESIS
jgi:beta-mannosidase